MSKDTDRTFDLALALAASIAANGIVAVATTANAAAKYAKPAGRLAGKIGDRLLGGSPFNEREAQRFLTMGGSERLDRAEEANEVLDPFWADGGPTEWLPGAAWISGVTCPTCHACVERDENSEFHCPCGVSLVVETTTNPSNPAGAAASEASTGGAYKPCVACDYTDNGWCGCGCHQGAPGFASPVEQAPGPAQTSPSCAGPGATSMPKALRQLDDLLRGLTIEPRSEHPMYAQIQDVADAAVVADVLGAHRHYVDHGGHYCHGSHYQHFATYDEWIAHVSPLVIAELQK